MMMMTMMTMDNDDVDEQSADKNTGGGGKRPLGDKLPDGFEIVDNDGDTWNLYGAIELHRLVLEGYDQLKKRKSEITSTIIDSTCYDDYFKEVSQPPLPLLAGHTTVHCM